VGYSDSEKLIKTALAEATDVLENKQEKFLGMIFISAHA